MSLGFPSSIDMGARKIRPRVLEGDLDDMYGLTPIFSPGGFDRGRCNQIYIL